MTYLGHKPTTIITEGRTPSLFHLFLGKLSKFTNWKKLNASNIVTATDSPPRCKVKNNLANDVQCELKIIIFYTNPALKPSLIKGF